MGCLEAKFHSGKGLRRTASVKTKGHFTCGGFPQDFHRPKVRQSLGRRERCNFAISQFCDFTFLLGHNKRRGRVLSQVAPKKSEKAGTKTVAISRTIHKKLREFAAMHEVSIADVANTAIESYLKKRVRGNKSN